MQYRINITNSFTVIGKVSRVVFPSNKPCNAVVQDGIVQVDYPDSPFALPLDRFYKYIEDDRITIVSAF